MEGRLDVILYRICFFKTLYQAKQWIRHNKIKINGQIVNHSHYKLQPGDVITVQSKKILESQIINNLQGKVKSFSQKYPTNISLKTLLMRSYRIPKHYSLLIKLKKKLQKNLYRDKHLTGKIRKKQIYKVKTKQIKKFLFLFGLYLKNCSNLLLKQKLKNPSEKKKKLYPKFPGKIG